MPGPGGCGEKRAWERSPSRSPQRASEHESRPYFNIDWLGLYNFLACRWWKALGFTSRMQQPSIRNKQVPGAGFESFLGDVILLLPVSRLIRSFPQHVGSAEQGRVRR